MSKSKELQKKLDKIKELSKIIVLHQGKQLSRETKQELDNWRGRMEFRLGQLLDEMKNREADVKIECMSEVVKLLKNV